MSIPTINGKSGTEWFDLEMEQYFSGIEERRRIIEKAGLRLKDKHKFDVLAVDEEVCIPYRPNQKALPWNPAPAKPSKTTWISSGIQRLKNLITQIVQNT